MGLVDKKNPRATPLSALRQGVICAFAGAIVFLCFKPTWREVWRVVLPMWCLLCGVVGALWEWQVADHSVDDEDG